MESKKLKDIFDQIEYYLIRLLLLALLLISAFKLLESEIHGADTSTASTISRLQCEHVSNSSNSSLVQEVDNTGIRKVARKSRSQTNGNIVERINEEA